MLVLAITFWLFLYLYSTTAGPRLLLRELAEEVTSVEELDRLASKVVQKRHRPVRRFLTHPNPHLRYAGGLASNPSDLTDVKTLINAINSEPSRSVRRVLAHKLGQCRREDLDRIFMEVSTKRTPELGYIVEMAARIDSLLSKHLERLPNRMRVLAILVGRDTAFRDGAASLGGGGLAAELVVSLYSPSSPLGHWLVEAFRKGLPGQSYHIEGIAEQDLRETLRDLSPFEEPGIAMLDDLEKIDHIDQLYLFFCQLRFYQERGLIGESAA